jgi:alpha-methylacyl-CoA racemase
MPIDARRAPPIAVSGRCPVSGPLEGIRIIELAGLGPAPFAGMMLADAGADIVRIDRSERATYPPHTEAHVDLMNRGRRSVAVDLKHPGGVALVLRLVEHADGLMEGFRPGVAERLGLGPDVCLARNPRLVFGRMTGWGQQGPMAQVAGHDIDYIAVAGALEPLGRAGQRPLPPLNLVGDFGGGGMLLAFGMTAAIISAQRTGGGQVVDAAMVDGAASLMTMNYTLRAAGMSSGPRGTNLLDTGAHFYEVYETSDGGFIGVGAIEPQFYAELIRLIGLEGEELPPQMDRDAWPQMKERLAKVFSGKTRHEWEEIFEGSDACAAPVLSPAEAPNHPHNRFRETFTEVSGVVQPSPSPRFEGTPGAIRRPPPNPGQHGDEALAEWGLAEGEITELRESGAIR